MDNFETTLTLIGGPTVLIELAALGGREALGGRAVHSVLKY